MNELNTDSYDSKDDISMILQIQIFDSHKF